MTGSRSCSSKTRVTRTYFELFNPACLYTWRNPRVTFAVRRIYNRKQLQPTVDTCHCTLSGFQVGMYLTRTQNLHQSRYNSFPEFKRPHSAAETSITQRNRTTLSSKRAVLHQRLGQLIHNTLSPVFTADYITEVEEITPLFMLPLRHYK